MNAPDSHPQETHSQEAQTIAELRACLDDERQFRDKLSVLFEIERELAQADTLDELCRLAVGLGRTRLGFDRLSIWLFEDEVGTLRGTYGTDEHGGIRDERGARIYGRKRVFTRPFLEEGTSLYIRRDAPLLNSTNQQVGIGDVAVVALWDGAEVIGHLNTDNFFSHVPLSDRREELLVLYASIIGHTYTRKANDERRRADASQFRMLSETAPVGIFNLDADGKFLYVNPQWFEITGLTPDAIKDAHWLESVHPEDRMMLLNKRRLQRRQGIFRSEFRYVRPDGKTRWVFGHARTLTDERGKVTGYVGTIEDLTERKSVQEQILQLHKMESIGRLAGSVAHDFRNLIMAIQGFTDLASDAETLEEAQGYFDSIQTACGKAKGLTDQLLAFARKQPIARKLFSLNTLILETDKILRRLIGAHIELIALPTENVGNVLADPVQMQQVLVNLVVNARDAMPHGGKIIVETANYIATADDTLRHVFLTPGEYVMLAVTDSGKGMDEETQKHIFEPFYTTKDEGKGTGLGLATCHSIVQQSGGHIWVYSEPDKGTVFKIYLPRAEAGQPEEIHAVPVTPAAGTETVLLAEDNPLLREFVVRTLTDKGYRVLEAANGDDALQVSRQHDGTIHLFLTDVIMPQKNGKEAAEILLAERPELKVIFMSGYTDNVALLRDDLTPAAPFLQKPFTATDLIATMRQVLDAGTK